MSQRSTFATVLLALWMVCLLHCFSEKLTSHWHVAESGQAHHHHHPAGSDPSHHDSGGEPLHSSDDNDGASSCSSAVLVVQQATLRAVPDGFQRPNLAPATLSLIGFMQRLAVLPTVPPKDRGSSLGAIGDSRLRIRSLRAPNAPPLSPMA